MELEGERLHLGMDGGVGGRALVPETDGGGTTRAVALKDGWWGRGRAIAFEVGPVDERLRSRHGWRVGAVALN